MRSQDPILSALYEERVSYMQREIQLFTQIDEIQDTISMIVNLGGDAHDAKLQFRDLIRRLSHLWDALTETNKQIREFKSPENPAKFRCPICNSFDCSLCIPF
tara:strand:+ start:523 stop:831 length:309 start_codon:yes stop_codon:yes gene_type:complete